MAVIGDSHAKDIFNALQLNQHLAPDYEFRMIWLKPGRERPDLLQDATHYIFAWRNFFPGTRATLTSMIERIAHLKRSFLILSRPEFPTVKGLKFSAPLTVLDYYLRDLGETHRFDEDDLNRLMYTSLHWERLEEDRAKMRQILQKVPMAFIDPYPLVCSQETCTGVTDTGRKTYYDGHHWTLAGAEQFGEGLVREFLRLDRQLGPLAKK